MAYDEGAAQILRDDLTDHTLVEKKMFGGLCFMLRGHMLCGVHKGGAMFRVGKDREAQALKVPGAGPMSFTGRPMSGMIETGHDTLEHDDTRRRLVNLALAFNRDQPPK